MEGGGSGLKATTLWTNQNPSSNFNSQTVDLAENLNNFDYYEITYITSIGGYMKSTGLIPLYTYTYLDVAGTYISKRSAEVKSSGSQIYFEDATRFTTYGSGTAYNSNCIPMQIIGFKSS